MDANVSDISICSTALLELGSRPINDFIEDNEPARLCANIYPYVRDEMLRLHPWNFAKKRIVLSPEVAKPEFGYEHQYIIPADFVRMLEVNGTPSQSAFGWPAGYEIENGKILTNQSRLYLRYIYQNHNPNTWEPTFVRLVIAALKRALAYAITRDPAAVSSASQDWALALQMAKTVNGIEQPPQEIIGATFLGGRY